MRSKPLGNGSGTHWFCLRAAVGPRPAGFADETAAEAVTGSTPVWAAVPQLLPCPGLLTGLDASLCGTWVPPGQAMVYVR